MNPLGGLLFALAAAAPTPAPQHWIAVSNGAISITGDVVITPTLVTYANGKSLRIRYERTANIAPKNGVPHGSARVFELYGIVDRQNPILQNGNVVCTPPATYLGIARSAETNPPGSTVFVNYYNGAEPPSGWSPADMCASFTYERKR